MLTNINRHILEAFINWCVENGFRPFITVDVRTPGIVCSQLGKYENFMPLNLSANACGRLDFAPDSLVIETAFNRKRETVFVPYEAIALFNTPDAEVVVPIIGDVPTRLHLQFPPVPMTGWVATGEQVTPPKPAKPTEKPKAKVSHLRVVK